MSWNAVSEVHRYFADESLPARESAALRAFARRDPRAWLSLLLNVVTAGVGVLWFYLGWAPQRSPMGHRDDAAVVALGVFCFAVATFYASWECALRTRTRRQAAGHGQLGALLTSCFGPRSLRLTTPDMAYEIPYASIAELVQFGDVLVIRPDSHPVLALPMELVPAPGLALMVDKVGARPAR